MWPLRNQSCGCETFVAFQLNNYIYLIYIECPRDDRNGLVIYLLVYLILYIIFIDKKYFLFS